MQSKNTNQNVVHIYVKKNSEFSQIYGDLEAAELEKDVQEPEEQFVFPRAFRFKKSSVVPFPRDFFKQMNNNDANKYKYWNLIKYLKY